MGYESLSTVVVLAIVVILMVIWLPRRTVKGMKQVIEHREDRFSPSLHLIDADSGTRFSDETVVKAKGAIMQSNETHEGRYSKERVARVRALRRAAIRRRRIIVAGLAAITVMVLVCAVAFHFSALFALIPAALLAVVLALGVRAAKQAVAWEQKVAKYRSTMRKKTERERKRARAEQAERVRLHERDLAEARKIAQAQTATDAMPEAEIRQAVEQGRAERDAALEQRKRETKRSSDSERNVQSARSVETAVEDSIPADSAEAVVNPSGLSVHDERDEVDAASDAAHQVVAQTKGSQDLISFSLGAPRNGNDIKAEEPESMEIKSTRQVAKAVPVDEVKPLIVPSDAMGDMDSDEAAARVEAGIHLRDGDASRFHDAEVATDVDAPDASSDSLGNDLEAILARRAA